MKKTMNIIFTAVLSLAVVSGIQAQSKNNEAEVTFSVSVDCDHCKKKIMNSIPHEKGVTDLKVDLAKKEVWIKFDSKKTDKTKLQKALEKLDFTVSEIVPKAEKTQQQTATGCAATCRSAQTGGCMKAAATKKSEE
ncbi:MAG: cation transporter [Prevotellaceae bacterium]|jgi:copper chaperone CopZ|nr:cation transporter [Prevotellaceae bacterium]